MNRLILALLLTLPLAADPGAPVEVPAKFDGVVTVPMPRDERPDELAKQLAKAEERLQAAELEHLDAEYDIGLVANDPKAAKPNTELLNAALEAGWGGGRFQFVNGVVGPVLRPIHFQGKAFWFEGTIRTSLRDGGHLIGPGRMKPRGNGEYGPRGLGGAVTQFIQADPDPKTPFLLVRNAGFQLDGIYLYGRHLPGNIHSGKGDKQGVGIALEGRSQPPTGRHRITNFAVVDCEIGMQFLAGYWKEDGDWVPCEEHADESTFADGAIKGGSIGIQSWNQQAAGHNFDRMSIAVSAGGTILDVHRGGNWRFTELFAGYSQYTLLKVYDFSPNNSYFFIDLNRDAFAGDEHRLTFFEYAGRKPGDNENVGWKDWHVRFRGNWSGERNAQAAKEIVRLNGLERSPDSYRNIWFDVHNYELLTPPAGLRWSDADGPWQRLMPEAKGTKPEGAK